MKQVMKEHQQAPQLQIVTGSSVENKLNTRQVATMTAYLENQAIEVTQSQAAALTSEERDAALKAVKYYRNLSLDQIETILEQDKQEREVVEQYEVIRKRKKLSRDRLLCGLLIGTSLLTIIILCVIYPDYRMILIPLTISLEAGFGAQSILIKGAYKK